MGFFKAPHKRLKDAPKPPKPPKPPTHKDHPVLGGSGGSKTTHGGGPNATPGVAPGMLPPIAKQKPGLRKNIGRYAEGGKATVKPAVKPKAKK